MKKITINREQVKKTIKASKERGKGFGPKIPYWKPEAGNNLFRIWAFIRQDTGAGVFFREIRIHFPAQGRPTICGFSADRTGLQKKGQCEQCDEAQTIYKERLAAELESGTDPKSAKQKANSAANRFRGRPRYLFIVSPLRTGGTLTESDEDKQPKVWWASKTTGEKIVEMMCDEDIIDDIAEACGATGRNLKVRYDPNADGASMYSVSLIDSAKSTALPKEWQELAQKLDLFSDDRYEPEWARGDAPQPVTDDSDEDDDSGAAHTDQQTEPHARTYTLLEDSPSSKERIRLDAEARLKADGLDDAWEVDVFPNGDLGDMACYYRKGEKDGQWEYPTPDRTPPPAEEKSVDEEVKARGFKGRKKSERTAAVLDDSGEHDKDVDPDND